MPQRIFGEIAGYPEGTCFESRASLSSVGIHRPLQAGICGSANEGAESIVLSGGYADDHDDGFEIIYTGHGGRNPETGEQVRDQQLVQGNMALVFSMKNKLPVRVVRGAKGSSLYHPRAGYRYDGLYMVEDYWQEKGRTGFTIWRYRLVKRNKTTAPWTFDAPTLLRESVSGQVKPRPTAISIDVLSENSGPSSGSGLAHRNQQPGNHPTSEFQVGKHVQPSMVAEGQAREVMLGKQRVETHRLMETREEWKVDAGTQDTEVKDEALYDERLPISSIAYLVLRRIGTPLGIEQLIQEVLHYKDTLPNSIRSMISIDDRLVQHGLTVGLRDWEQPRSAPKVSTVLTESQEHTSPSIPSGRNAKGAPGTEHLIDITPGDALPITSSNNQTASVSGSHPLSDRRPIQDMVAQLLTQWGRAAYAMTLVLALRKLGYFIATETELEKILTNDPRRFHRTRGGWDVRHQEHIHISAEGPTPSKEAASPSSAALGKVDEHLSGKTCPQCACTNRPFARRCGRCGAVLASIEAVYTDLPRADSRVSALRDEGGELEEQIEPLRDALVDALDLSIKSRNALLNAGITKVQQLKQLYQVTPERLWALRNVGARCIEEIGEALAHYDARVASGLDPHETAIDNLGLSGDAPILPKLARAISRPRHASNGTKPITLLEDDPSVYQEDIAYTSKADRDSSSIDDLDRAERFDLDDTQFRNGTRSVDNISIVEVIDDTYDNLGLSIKSRNALLNAGITKVQQLKQLYQDTPERLWALRNVGARCIEEIGEALAYYDARVASGLDPEMAIDELLSKDVQATETDSSLREILDLRGYIVLQVSIAELELELRTANALKRNKVSTINALAELSPERLKSLRNVGAKMVEEIELKLKKYWDALPPSSFMASPETADKTSDSENKRDVGPLDAAISQGDMVEQATTQEITAFTDVIISQELQTRLRSAGISLDELPVPTRVLRLLQGQDSSLLTLRDALEYSCNNRRHFSSGTGMVPTYILGIEKDLRRILTDYLERLLSALQLVQLSQPSIGIPYGHRLSDLLALLFLDLTEREIDVLVTRHGLRSGHELTLQETAEGIGVTRERVRQIEKGAIAKLTGKSYVDPKQVGIMLFNMLEPCLDAKYGAATLTELAAYLANNQWAGSGSLDRILRFLLENTSALNQVGDDIYLAPPLKGSDLDIPTIRAAIIDRLEREETQVEIEQLVTELQQLFPQITAVPMWRLAELAIESTETLSRDENHMVGLRQWDRRWTDELIRAMRQLGRPTHYERITEVTNALLPVDQQVSTHNVHAMMQRRSDVFVRVGNGKYGLAAWGIAKDRTTGDAVYRILSDVGVPLSVRELTRRVLEQRHVKASSVNAAIGIDSRFCRVGAKIGLAEWNTAIPASQQPSQIAHTEDMDKQEAGAGGQPTRDDEDELETLLNLLLGNDGLG